MSASGLEARIFSTRASTSCRYSSLAGDRLDGAP